jgi:hypothetical protein
MKELIILGMGGTRNLCPFDGAEIWSCNDGYRQIYELKGYLDKIFMSHTQHTKLFRTEAGKEIWSNAYNVEQMNKLIDSGVEILNIHKIDGLKSTLFPLEEINDKFKCNHFFSDTIAYMLAYALHISTDIKDGKLVFKDDGFKKIRIYGVDMLTKDEYELEKGGIEYFIGYAQGLGVEIEITKESALMKTCTGKPYGMPLDLDCLKEDLDPYYMLETDKSTMWAAQAGLNAEELKKVMEKKR